MVGQSLCPTAPPPSCPPPPPPKAAKKDYFRIDREREEAKRNARLKHTQFNSHPHPARSRIFSLPCPVHSLYIPPPATN